MSEQSKSSPDTRTRRVRLYAGIGVAFWVVAAIVAYGRGAGGAIVGVLAFLAAAVAVALAIGWFHEPTGAIVMVAIAVASVAYGFLTHWDLAFWGMMLVALIGPALIAAYLFDAARRDQVDDGGSA